MSDAPRLPTAADDPELADLCVRAVAVAAHDLGLDPRLFAEELAQGEVALLVKYLRETAPAVAGLPLRTRVDELLHRLTTWTAATD